MEISDHELMRRIKDGDVPAFDVLVRRWEHRLYNVVYKIIYDIETTRDLCQEIFLQVYKSAKKYKPTAQFETWLYRIAINSSINELRKQKRYQMYSLDNQDDAQISLDDIMIDRNLKPDEIVQQDEMALCIQNAIAKLPADQRIVVTLRHYEGLKYQQIAEILNCPLGTVKSRMYSAIEQLRTLLKHIV